ncbi:homoserine O-acetyltransferase MetX [Spirochaeta thermophila]|uniref:Homoserine O-acetyltransferase n=1 Tax=Winmispira thermophila (strain ATCC 49972 / DSM 6192 / RI 19.B1) TaxID=665571 RepID=E0RRU7_WINT6|nr:homoserine O-acetyltransferase [Spirochaeta thermophila]ADN01734.1 homoserine O-acetyltransferase [Spirochaeta thermophila DSM 6192]
MGKERRRWDDGKGIGLVTPQDFTFGRPGEGLILESGKSFGPITIRYETYGELNRDRSNAVLILHAFSGDAHVAGFHSPDDPSPGWWDTMVGPGKAFDTNRYFVICSNVLGGCQGSTGPSSINPETGSPYGMSFPVITIGDMVNAQVKLIEHLGIERLLAVAGGSMGGMQALEWVTAHPERVRSAVILASTARLTAQGIAFNAVGRNAIISDPRWNNGDYYGKEIPARGLAIARMIGHITYLSDEAMRDKFGRRLQNRETYGYDFEDQFSVESYLEYQGDKFVERFDANTYIYLTKAMDYFDLSEKYGSLVQAFSRVMGKMLVVSFSSDWLYPPYQSKEIVFALMKAGKDVSYVNIDCPYGHDAFLIETERQTPLIASFLETVARETTGRRSS